MTVLSPNWLGLFDFSHATMERNVIKLESKQIVNGIYQVSKDWGGGAKLDRKQVLNVVDVCVFRAGQIKKNKENPFLPLIDEGISDFPFVTAVHNVTKINKKQVLTFFSLILHSSAKVSNGTRACSRPLLLNTVTYLHVL